MTTPPSSALSDFTVLPLALPQLQSLPSFAPPALHYIYVRPHAPKLVNADSARSLFAANVPFDANEASLRKLFADQLGGTRIERVEFEAEDIVHGSTLSRTKRRTASDAAEEVDAALVGTQLKSRGRKRKRRDDEADLEAPEAQLPSTWDQGILKSGSCAVLIFVDRASADVAMKACRKAASSAHKTGTSKIEWGGAGGLGFERTSGSQDPFRFHANKSNQAIASIISLSILPTLYSFHPSPPTSLHSPTSSLLELEL